MSNNPNSIRTVLFTGLVLAGGTSSRMGKDKAGLLYKGQSWLNHSAQLLKQAGAANILVNCHTESEFTNVTEPYPNQGPLSGIYAGLIASTLPVFVMPVDMPTLNVTQIRKLVEQGERYSCVYFCDSPLPCYLWNTPEQQHFLASILTNPCAKKSLFNTWKGLNAHEVETSLPLDNFNLPEDLV